MFNNLLAEFKKNNLELNEIAQTLEISPSSLYEKIQGKRAFELKECLKLQRIIGSGDLCLDYLFQEN